MSESKGVPTGITNVSGNTVISGGAGIVIGVVLALIFAFAVGIGCDDCEDTTVEETPVATDG